MHKLSFYEGCKKNQFNFLESNDPLFMHSPAVEAMLDFRHHENLMIEVETPALDIVKIMRQEHATFKIVVNRQEKFLGILTPNHLQDQEFMRRASWGFSPAELTASDLMVAVDDLMALEYGELLLADVSDLVKLFTHSGQRHCLVVDPSNKSINGVLCVDTIERRLGKTIAVEGRDAIVDIYEAC